MKKILLILPFLIGCEYVNYAAKDDINELVSNANNCFAEAEKEILGNSPKPDDVVGPHPDPAKCVCKGSGVITHGDGHTSPCPYHAKQEPEQEPKINVEQPKQTTQTEKKPSVVYERPSTGTVIRRY